MENIQNYAQENAKISLMSFNILFENPLEHLKDLPNSWKKRKEYVVSLLKTYNADIICLQECLFSQLKYIKKGLEDEYDSFGSNTQTYHWSDINQIFYKKNKFDFIKGGRQWFSNTPDKPGSIGYGNTIPRTFTWALLSDKVVDSEKLMGNIKRRYLVISTHLDVFSFESRRKSLIQLVNFINNFEEEFDIILLLGDFNSFKKNETLMLEEEPLNLIDSVTWGLDVMRSSVTYNGFTPSYGWRIDYIFYGDKNKRGIIKKGVYQVIEDMTSEGGYISDHYPVFCLLEITD